MIDFDIIGFGPEFCPSHILDPHDGSIRVGAEGDDGKLLGCLKQALDDDGSVQTLPFHRRRATKLPGGHFHVVGLQRCDDILNCHLVIGQLVGVQPDAHRVLRAEFLDLADPGHACQHLLQVGLGIIPQIVAVHAVVFRDQAHNDQIIPRGFADHDARSLDHLRQTRHGELELVLHLGPSQVRIGSRFEGQFEAGRAG